MCLQRIVIRIVKNTDMKTINDLIKELQNLKPSLRKLPVCVVAPNGLTFEAKAKVLMIDKQTMFDEPTKMVITYD